MGAKERGDLNQDGANPSRTYCSEFPNAVVVRLTEGEPFYVPQPEVVGLENLPHVCCPWAGSSNGYVSSG